MNYEKLNLQEGDVLTAEHIAHIENAIETLSNAGSGSGETKTFDCTGIELANEEGTFYLQFNTQQEFEEFVGMTAQEVINFLDGGGCMRLTNVAIEEVFLCTFNLGPFPTQISRIVPPEFPEGLYAIRYVMHPNLHFGIVSDEGYFQAYIMVQEIYL